MSSEFSIADADYEGRVDEIKNVSFFFVYQ